MVIVTMALFISGGDAKMLLYHVSMGKSEKIKTFEPRVPISCVEEFGEDSITPRICFASSITLCLQAILGVPDYGTLISIYTFSVDDNDPNLVSPSELFITNRVPDALENQEYWYLKPVTLEASYSIITNRSREFDIAWTTIPQQTMIEIAHSSIEHNHLSIDEASFKDMTSKEIYSKVATCLDSMQLWDEEDTLYDRVSELPWAQIKRLNFVETVPYNGERYCIVIFRGTINVTFTCNYDKALEEFMSVSEQNRVRLIDYEKQCFAISCKDKLKWRSLYDTSELQDIEDSNLIAPKKLQI